MFNNKPLMSKQSIIYNCTPGSNNMVSQKSRNVFNAFIEHTLTRSKSVTLFSAYVLIYSQYEYHNETAMTWLTFSQELPIKVSNRRY